MPRAVRYLSSLLFPEAIVARVAFEGFMVVYQRPAMAELGRLGVGVVALWRHKDDVEGARPDFAPLENTSLQSAVTSIKKAMLDHGASAESIELIGAIEPFSEGELSIMADKLAKKTPPKADAKKPAAGGKPKGNTEALAKARAEKTAKAAENRKYKTTAKLKDIKLRPDSWTERMVTIIMSNNTTDDARAELAKDKTFSDKKLDFTWAEKKGYIAF